MTKTIGRRVVDIGQKARGRMALRYELEVIPYLCGDIPDGVTHCSFAWERGSKLFVTEAEPVNPNTHAVFWKQYLRQTATMYKDHTELLPKDYAFKVQSVKAGSKPGEEKRKTLGKAHVNLAQFCSEALDAQPQEVLLHLKPYGKLKVSIKATWLRNARVESDALTEVTATSLYADSHDEGEEEGGGEGCEEEQDLSGFDPETGEPLPSHYNNHARASRRGGAGASTSGAAAEELHEGGNPMPPRRSRKSRRRRKLQSYDEDGIPEDAESAYGAQSGEEEGSHGYGDPGEKGGGGGGEEGHGEHGGGRGGDGHRGAGRRGRAGSRASKGEGRPRLQVYGADAGWSGGGGGGGGGLQIAAGRQIHKASWQDYLCCCLPRRGPVEDPLEGDSLLAANEARRQRPAAAGAAASNGQAGAPQRR